MHGADLRQAAALHQGRSPAVGGADEPLGGSRGHGRGEAQLVMDGEAHGLVLGRVFLGKVVVSGVSFGLRIVG